MELIFKLPPNKPPFIGIAFAETELRTAGTLNQDLVDDRADHSSYVIAFHPGSRKLFLQENYTGLMRFYKDLKFDPEKARDFSCKASQVTMLNFGHVISKFDGHQLVKTMEKNKNFVLKIDSYSFIEGY